MIAAIVAAVAVVVGLTAGCVVLGVMVLLRIADEGIREWHGPGQVETSTDDKTRED